ADSYREVIPEEAPCLLELRCSHIERQHFPTCVAERTYRCGLLRASSRLLQIRHAITSGVSVENGNCCALVRTQNAVLQRSAELSCAGKNDGSHDAMPDQTRIVIVDDHPFVREGLKQLLAGQGDFVLSGEASSMQDAQAAIAGEEPDVAVVDLAL